MITPTMSAPNATQIFIERYLGLAVPGRSQLVGRNVLRDEILLGTGPRCSRRPSGKRPEASPQLPCLGGVSGVCHSSVVARQGLPPAGLPLNNDQTRLNKNTNCTTATTKAEMVIHWFMVRADAG